MSIILGTLAVLLGVGAFAFANPAGVPIFGLALAAAGFLRELRGRKRIPVVALLVLGSLINALGTLRSFHLL